MDSAPRGWGVGRGPRPEPGLRKQPQSEFSGSSLVLSQWGHWLSPHPWVEPGSCALCMIPKEHSKNDVEPGRPRYLPEAGRPRYLPEANTGFSRRNTPLGQAGNSESG